jgi:hypothetical protein
VCTVVGTLAAGIEAVVCTAGGAVVYIAIDAVLYTGVEAVGCMEIGFAACTDLDLAACTEAGTMAAVEVPEGRNGYWDPCTGKTWPHNGAAVGRRAW